MKEGKVRKERDGMQEEIKTRKTRDKKQMKLDVICKLSKLNQNFQKSFF
jgi:hypothetical protein